MKTPRNLTAEEIGPWVRDTVMRLGHAEVSTRFLSTCAAREIGWRYMLRVAMFDSVGHWQFTKIYDPIMAIAQSIGGCRIEFHRWDGKVVYG